MTARLVNETAFRVGRFRASFDAPDDALVVVVKGTFRIVPDGIATALPADAQLRPCLDTPYADQGGTEVYYPSDYAPFKPRADLLVVGSAHAPGGRAVTRLDVAVTLGNHRKALVVHGDRYWIGDDGDASPPEPFLAMPLTWSRAYGSDDFLANPFGRGRHMPWEGQAGGRRPLPNVELPDAPVTAPECDAPAAGFAPIGAAAPLRVVKEGRRDRRWLNREAPVPPDDFDWGYHNAAPDDQQIDGYFRGDETIAFENMNSGHPHLETRLPGLRMRGVALRDGVETPEEMAFSLDTVWADAGRERLVLAWRSRLSLRGRPVADRYRDGIQGILIAAERLDAAPEAPAVLAERLRRRLARTPPRRAASPVAADRAGAGALSEAHRRVPESARAATADVDDPAALITALAATMPDGQNGASGAAPPRPSGPGRAADRRRPTGRS